MAAILPRSEAERLPKITFALARTPTDADGTALPRRPDGMITLATDGEQFARDADLVLEALAHPRSSRADHAP